MKRSEIIKLIYDSFKNAEAGDSLEAAEYVLERLEEVGMLPLDINPNWGPGSEPINEWEDE